MGKYDALILQMFRRLTPEDQDFVTALAASMLAAQKEGKPITIPTAPKKEA